MTNKCLKQDRDSLKRAENLIGDRSDFELKNMKKALKSMGGFFNSQEDNQRLKAVNTIIKLRKRCK